MKNLQAQIKAIRALQTDMNLAKQPDAEPPASHEAEVRAEMNRAETNVVEMPERVKGGVSETKPATRSRRKAQTPAKRKSSTTTAKPKASVPFRQLRESQELSLDELRRLQDEAERITQRLVNQSSESPESPEPTAASEPSELAARSPASTQKKSSKRSSQTHLSYDQGEVPPMPPKDEETESSKIHADRIQHLLAELEDAIQQAGTINPPPLDSNAPATVEGVPRRTGNASPKSTRRSTGRKTPPAPPQSQRQVANPEPRLEEPLPEYAARNRKQVLQEAVETAEALRYLTNLERQHLQQQSHYPSETAYPGDLGRQRSAPPRRSSAKPFGIRLRELFQMPRKPMDKLGDAVLWIVLSVVVRVGSRFLIAQFPAYTPLIIALMLAPAALAVYLAVFVPRAGFVSVYRLFLIMLGLLLGGKL